ncbi:unnamed protein product [Mytilus edulis]|uniref:Uncharacterized protein n=1 Tax=Mytilus edulis TaxID=6550 RepID=A0A8S3R646_MYTED|nr:unnamed protein product [Mytilus edulis]
MSIHKQRETTRCEASTVGQNFLDTNPKCLQKFKDFCMASDNEISPHNQTDGPVMFINTTDCDKDDSNMSNGSSHRDNHSGSTTEIDEEHNVDFKSKKNDLVDGISGTEDFETEVNESIKEMYEKQNFEEMNTNTSANEKTDELISGENLTKVLPMKGNVKKDELSKKGFLEKVNTTIKTVEEIGQGKDYTQVPLIIHNEQINMINEKRNLEKQGMRTIKCNDKINEISKQSKLEKMNMMKKNKQIDKMADSVNLEKNHRVKINKQINTINERAAFEKDNFMERNETMEAVNEVMNFENPDERRNFYHHLYGSLLAETNAMHNTCTMNR